MFLVSFQFCSLFIYFIGLFCFSPRFSMIYFHRPREESMSLGRECFKRSCAARFGVSRPRIKRFCIRFPSHTLFIGENCFFPGSNSQYIFNPLHPLFDRSHTSVSPLSSGGFNTIPDSSALFLSSVLRRRAQLGPQFYPDNQKISGTSSARCGASAGEVSLLFFRGTLQT